LKKSAAPGVDEMTWTEYAEGLEENLSDLHSRVHLPSKLATWSLLPDADTSSLRTRGPNVSCAQGKCNSYCPD
jgi:hypothetical protein